MEYDLVFEGGGAKGMVFVGAMQEFEARGHRFNRLLGTSAGAITAALLAAGYTPAEMLEALIEQKDGVSVFTSFLALPSPFEREAILKSATLEFLAHTNLPFVPDFLEHRLEERLVQWLAENPRMRPAYSLLEYGGWYSADNFVGWMQKRLDSGLNQGKLRCYSSLTLSQFFEETRVDVSFVASDTTGGQMLVLNHTTAPDLPLVWSVRMSMSIPLLWQAVVWLDSWGQYRGKEMTGHVIVDGGLLSNFPIELFISNEEIVKSLMGPKEKDNVLGLLIDETLDVDTGKQAVIESTQYNLAEFPAIQHISSLLNTTLSAHDKMVIDAFEKLVARMPAKGYGTTEFNMSDEKRSKLIDAGRTAMKAYFEAQESSASGLSFDLEMPDPAEEARKNRLADKVALKILQ
jgi:NTE family protein